MFSKKNTANLAHVIPVMDTIDKVFATQQLKKKDFNPAICHALGLAKRTMNRYYNKTDNSELYRIAMSKFLILDI